MSEELEQRYLYTVNPKRPIRNLNDNIPLLRVPKTLSLTKEEVLKCLEGGSVYRRFSNQGLLEKVNKYDIDRVHRDKFISKQDWEKLQQKEKDVANLNVNGNDNIQPTNGDPSVVVAEEKEEEPVYSVTVETIDTTEAEYVEGEPEVIKSDKPYEPAETITLEELETSTSGYVETEEDAEKELPESTTVTNNDEPVEIDYKDLTNEESTEESEDEEESDEEEEASEDASNTTSTKTVVNYGKKKKHKH